MAWNLGRADRAAGHDSTRNRSERRPARDPPAVILAVWTFGSEADLRRRRRKLQKPREGSRAAYAGNAAAGRCAPDGNGLESRRPDLLLHASQLQSPIRCHGAEIAPGLGGREKPQVGT